MEAKYTKDQLDFALEILNHPEWLREDFVQNWLAQKENVKLYEECRVYLEAGLRLDGERVLDVEVEYKKFCQKMEPRSDRRMLRWIPVAASVLLVMFFGWWTMERMSDLDKGHLKVSQAVVVEQERILPGRHHAVLVTGNNKEIVLDETGLKQVEVEKGVQIDYDSLSGMSYTQTGSTRSYYHTLRIPKGGEYKVVLNDGTEVWLNSGSELRYPTVFTGDKREVELKGEGYFSVAPDEKVPFVVVAAGVCTKVYGTEFNVRAYEGKDVNVTLVKGRVAVRREEARQEYALNPGENACFTGRVPEVSRVNVQKYAAWKDGYFYYEDESLETIMDEFKRWYDFDVVYIGNQVKDLKFEFWASRDSEFSKITRLLMQTNKIKVQVNGRVLTISEVNR